MNKTFTPLRYPGGKSQFYNQVKKILLSNNIQHSTYIEPFAGGAGVAIRLLLEGYVDNIIINDIDEAIYAFWHTVLFDNGWLVSKIYDTEVNMAEWEKQKNIYLNHEKYSLKELGFATLFLNRCNRSGILSAGPIGGKKQLGNYKIDCRFNKQKLISCIRDIGMYKKRIKVYNLDAIDLIKKRKHDDNTFWFIDPPYFVKGAELYKNSYEKKDHQRLASIIKKNLNNQSWILTYDIHDNIYELYKNYQHECITLTYSVEKKRKEQEFLFFNKLIIREDLLV